jgi:DNA-binding NarL/FixJ family response regulator
MGRRNLLQETVHDGQVSIGKCRNKSFVRSSRRERLKSAGRAAKQALIEVCKVNPQEGSGSAIRVLVVNESGFIREGLCKVIERFRGVDVVSATSCANDLEALVQSLSVDVALIDSQFPNQAGFDAAHRLQKSGVETQVVILSINPSLADVKKAFQAGAIGFLLRDAGISDLEIALRAAVRGEVFLCPTLLKRLYGTPASYGILEGVSTGANANHTRYSIDEMLLKAQYLGILQQDY